MALVNKMPSEFQPKRTKVRLVCTSVALWAHQIGSEAFEPYSRLSTCVACILEDIKTFIGLFVSISKGR